MGSILFDGVELDHILIWRIAFLVEVIHSILLKDMSRKLVILKIYKYLFLKGDWFYGRLKPSST